MYLFLDLTNNSILELNKYVNHYKKSKENDFSFDKQKPTNKFVT